jgi:hypothetical protein
MEIDNPETVGIEPPEDRVTVVPLKRFVALAALGMAIRFTIGFAVLFIFLNLVAGFDLELLEVAGLAAVAAWVKT